jgi:uncharacterized protein YfiM (DUF2279 family)
MRLSMMTLLLLAATAAGASAQDDRWLGRDKGLHFAAGAAVGFGGYFAGSLVFHGRAPRVAVGLSLGLGAGAAKELRDRRAPGPTCAPVGIRSARARTAPSPVP